MRKIDLTDEEGAALVRRASAHEKRSAIAKARWADPVSGAKMRAAVNIPARRAKIREATKARWADPAGREKMITDMRAGLSDPVVHQKRASAAKERWADPAMREKMIAGMRIAGKRRRKRDGYRWRLEPALLCANPTPAVASIDGVKAE